MALDFGFLMRLPPAEKLQKYRRPRLASKSYILYASDLLLDSLYHFYLKSQAFIDFSGFSPTFYIILLLFLC